MYLAARGYTQLSGAVSCNPVTPVSVGWRRECEARSYPSATAAARTV
jgi:hypothetical protein